MGEEAVVAPSVPPALWGMSNLVSLTRTGFSLMLDRPLARLTCLSELSLSCTRWEDVSVGLKGLSHLMDLTMLFCEGPIPPCQTCSS